MVLKIFRIAPFLCLFFFYQSISYAKTFDDKDLYNYFSALISLEKNKSTESLKYFESSKELKESHPSYIKKYLFSLVLSKKINKAIRELKTTKQKNFTDFFEAHLLLVLDSLKKNDYKKSLYHLNDLKRHGQDGTYEFIISSLLEEYIYLSFAFIFFIIGKIVDAVKFPEPIKPIKPSDLSKLLLETITFFEIAKDFGL